MMGYVDAAIVKYWDLVSPIGVDAVRRDAQLILDGTPCNEARGWYGEKPGCTRDKAKSADKKAERKATKPKAAKKPPKAKSGPENNAVKTRGIAPQQSENKASTTNRDTKTIDVGLLSKAQQEEVASKITDNLKIAGKSAGGVVDFDTPIYDNAIIHTSLARRAVTTPESIRIVQDKDGNIQASAAVEKRKDHVFVDYLATAPWNMPDAPDDDRKKKGMGTRLMLDIVKESFSSGNKGVVRLQAKQNAIGFYEKMGFKAKKGYYELTENAAKALLEKMGERMDAKEKTFADQLADLEDNAGGALATNYNETRTPKAKQRLAKLISVLHRES